MKFVTLTVAILLTLTVGCKSKNEEKKEGVSTEKASASAKEITDETLFGFMLGGMYPAFGFGGVPTVMERISEGITAEEGSKEYLEQMATSYKQVFAYPFEASQSSDVKATLSSLWSITDKTSLMKTLDELIDAKHSKAWDLARYANVINLAQCANYITKDEGNELVKKIVPIAKQNYNDWETYMKEYNAGRVAWDAAASDGAGFDKATKELLTTKKSIYKYLKL